MGEGGGTRMKTSLVITSYHIDDYTVELTRKCLASLKYGRPDEVILVDDCSPIQAGFDGVDNHIKRPVNGGFPKCANTGFKAATGDVIILSNNDIEYNPGWLEALLEALENGYDVASLVMSDQTYVTKDEITEGDRFGSLWAMKRKVYETIGGFDETFEKGTFEDLDFHQRVLKAGFRIGKNHKVVVEHVGRATMDKVYPDRIDFKEGKQRYLDKYGRID